MADVFVNNRATIAGQKVAEGKTARVATTVATEGQRAAQGHQGARGGHFPQWRGGTSGTRSPTKSGRVKCYACGGFGHMARDCVSSRGNGRAGGNAEFAGVDNAGVVKSAIWVVIIGYFNNRFMDFNRLFVAALMGNLNM